MNNLFVFCIGGTGLRVMKSLLMLLASGIEIKGYNLIPIIIDPHKDLDELKKLKVLIENYGKIYRAINGNQPSNYPGFFKTNVLSLDRLAGNEEDVFDFDQRIDSTFRQYINLNNLADNDISKQFIESLYSEVNLSKPLSVGFKGSPNIGSVVLDSIDNATWFKTFTNQVQHNDKIFVISSIFGGTGASGFPILLKKLSQSTSQNVKDALKGGLTVQPYFQLDTPSEDAENKEIDSSTFASKAKSALLYYSKNLSVDHLYYIGDKIGISGKVYKNDEIHQSNEAHLIEMIGATSVVHFAKQVSYGQKIEYSLAIGEDVDCLNLINIGSGYHDIIQKLTNLTILRRVISYLPKDKHFPHTKALDLSAAFESKDFSTLKVFLNDYSTWMKELAYNRRAFEPLNISAIENQLEFEPLIGKAPNEIKFFKKIPFGLSYYILKIIEAGNNITEKIGNISNPFNNLMYITSQGISEVNKVFFK